MDRFNTADPREEIVDECSECGGEIYAGDLAIRYDEVCVIHSACEYEFDPDQRFHQEDRDCGVINAKGQICR